MNFYIDLETVPTTQEWIKQQISNNIKPPGNITKPESIGKWMIEKAPYEADKQIRKTALNGSVGEILMIGYAIEDEPVQVIRRTLEQPEADILHEFSIVMADACVKANGHTKTTKNLKWIGHNITGFDLRFLWQRMKVNNIKGGFNIPYNAKPWDEDKVFDTYTQWAGFKSDGFNDLDTLCKVFDIDLPKGDIDGSKVYDAALEGRYDDLAKYCAGDVERTRQLFKRMTD